jgi:hypothetical protein
VPGFRCQYEPMSIRLGLWCWAARIASVVWEEFWKKMGATQRVPGGKLGADRGGQGSGFREGVQSSWFHFDQNLATKGHEKFVSAPRVSVNF